MQCIRKSLLTNTYSYIVLTQTDMVADSVLFRFVTRVQKKEQQIQIQINQYVVFTVCNINYVYKGNKRQTKLGDMSDQSRLFLEK